MSDLPSDRASAAELLDIAIANVAAYPRWSLVRRQPFGAPSICVTESGYFINYSVDEPDETDGILVCGSSMWVTGDLWKGSLFNSRMTLPTAVENSGRRWLRCETTFGRAKIGPEADPMAVLKAICSRGSASQLRVSSEPGGYLLTGPSLTVQLIEDGRTGLRVGRVSEDGADLVAVELDGARVLPKPTSEDTLDRDDVIARKAPSRGRWDLAAQRESAEHRGTAEHRGSGRTPDIELHHDVERAEPEFAWVVSSYEIIEAVNLETAHDVEDLLISEGLLGEELSNEVVFDSPGDQLIAFCSTRKVGERLISALRLLA